MKRFARLIERPAAGYLGAVERLSTALAGRQLEASRQLDAFARRLNGLSTDELQELFDETFRGQVGEVRAVLARTITAPAGRVDVAGALGSIEQLLPALEADRNPFIYLLKAAFCVLLTCRRRGAAAVSSVEQSR